MIPVRTSKQVSARASPRTSLPPGRPGALPRRAPLRTGRAAFTAHGSSKPLGRVGVQMLRSLPRPAVAAVERVGEAGFGFVRRAVRPGGGRDDRYAGVGQPLFPLVGVLGWVVDGRSEPPQIGQRPSCASRSRRLVLPVGRGVACAVDRPSSWPG